MAKLTAVYKSLWTPLDLGRNTTPCDWLFAFGWLFLGLAIFTLPRPAVSSFLFNFAGWLITSGSLVQRFQVRLWPFNLDFVRRIKGKAADTHRLATAIYKAEMQAERPALIFGMVTLVFFGIILLALVTFAH